MVEAEFSLNVESRKCIKRFYKTLRELPMEKMQMKYDLVL
jgi:hypothetical protein